MMTEEQYIELDKNNIADLVSFVENDQEEHYGVKIVHGDYNAIVYTYGKVNLSEDPNTESLNVKFDFKLNVVPGKFDKEELENSSEFKDFIGYILIRLIEENNNEQHPETNT